VVSFRMFRNKRVTSAVLKPILKAIFKVPGSVAEQYLFIAESGSDFGKVSVSVPDSKSGTRSRPQYKFYKILPFYY
jgi:hypothetical protein